MVSVIGEHSKYGDIDAEIRMDKRVKRIKIGR
jgi:hypothetical protein